MNPIIKHILEQLDGTDSTKTISTEDIALRAKLDIDVSTTALEQLYRNGQVNRATVYRDGQSKTLYWLTGVVRTVPLRDPKPAAIQPPRRSETTTTPAPVTELEKAQPMETTATQPTKTQKIMDYLLEHRTASSSELCKIADTTRPGAFLKSYINRGIVIVSDDGDRKLGKTYSLAYHITREHIDQVRQANPAARKQLAETPAPAEQTAPIEDAVPRFTIVPPASSKQASPEQIAIETIIQAIGTGITLRVNQYGIALEDLYGNTYHTTLEEVDQTIQAINHLNSKRAA